MELNDAHDDGPDLDFDEVETALGQLPDDEDQDVDDGYEEERWGAMALNEAHDDGPDMADEMAPCVVDGCNQQIPLDTGLECTACGQPVCAEHKVEFQDDLFCPGCLPEIQRLAADLGYERWLMRCRSKLTHDK